MSLTLMVSRMSGVSVKGWILGLEKKKFEFGTVMTASCQWVDRESLTNQKTGLDIIDQSEDDVSEPWPRSNELFCECVVCLWITASIDSWYAQCLMAQSFYRTLIFYYCNPSSGALSPSWPRVLDRSSFELGVRVEGAKNNELMNWALRNSRQKPLSWNNQALIEEDPILFVLIRAEGAQGWIRLKTQTHLNHLRILQ